MVTNKTSKKRDHCCNVAETMVSISLITQRLMLMEEPKKSWVKRSVFSKIFWGGPGPNDKGLSNLIFEGTKVSLKRLDMDCVVVISCHRPLRLKRQWGQWITWLIKGGHFTGGPVNGELNKSLKLGALRRSRTWWDQLVVA